MLLIAGRRLSRNSIGHVYAPLLFNLTSDGAANRDCRGCKPACGRSLGSGVVSEGEI